MKPLTQWIIRIALTVQFLGVLAVPGLVAAAESPRAMWMAEWLRPATTERTIGVLRIRDGKLSFVEQVGQVDWELELANVKRATAVNGGRSLTIEMVSGEQYSVAIMEPNLIPTSAKKAVSTIERARELLIGNAR